MPRAEWCRPEIYALFDRWRRDCLISDRSLFSSDGRPIWTAEYLADLERTFATEIHGAGTFIDKLRIQIAGHRPAVRQLGVEIAYLQLLCERDTAAAKKRENLAVFRDLLEPGAEIPEDLLEILDGGVASYGPGKAYRDAYVRLILRFAKAAKVKRDEGSIVALEDPWAFRDLASSVRTSTDTLQTNAVLHGCFPDEFDVMISAGHRKQILAAFAGNPAVLAEHDEAKQLLAVRRALIEDMPSPVNNPYAETVRDVWNQPTNAGWATLLAAILDDLGSLPVGDAERHAPDADVELRERTLEIVDPSGVHEQPWDSLLLEAAVRVVAQGGNPRPWSRLVSALRSAVSRIEPPLDGDRVRRRGADDGVARGTGQPTKTVIPRELAQELLLPLQWLQQTSGLLERRRQLILHGPPGTGKTFFARRLANEIAGDEKRIRLVQFHPSYAYEDFVEGFRPVTHDGALSYALVRGPLLELAAQANRSPGEQHVLVIDEINRGNMAKIFGELYFLLEYRDEPIRLQYSNDEEFRLPENLLVIGTMNTADRSIALLDAALRRRFAFRELSPLVEPIDGLLARWLDRHGLEPEPAILLATLNRLLNEADGDPDLAVGPSYFMTRTGEAPDLDEIWAFELMPLLRERFHGTGVDVESEFGLGRVRKAVEAQADAVTLSVPAPPDTSTDV